MRKKTKPKLSQRPKVNAALLQQLIGDWATKFHVAQQRIAELEGLMDSGRLIGRPEAVVAMAAKVAHEVNRAYCRHLGDDSQMPWKDAPEWQKNSCIAGVKAIAEDQLLSPAAQHALWCRHKKEEGWTFGDVKDLDAKTHPCLMPYSDLPVEQQLKDVLFGAAVRAVLGVSDG